MEVLKVKNLCKRYSGESVIENLSFTLEKGESLYIVGENGSGKTTLIKLLLGLTEETSGEIKMSGIKRNQIGYLPQQNEIQSDFPAGVFEVVLSGFLNRISLLPFYTKSQKTEAESILKRLDILPLKNRSFRELSGGQKQRVLLARALCATGEILLLDEPLTALDPKAQAEFYELLEQLRNQGVTLIIISHDVRCAVHHGDKILHLGKNESFFGTAEEYKNSEIGIKMLAEGHHHD